MMMLIVATSAFSPPPGSVVGSGASSSSSAGAGIVSSGASSGPRSLAVPEAATFSERRDLLVEGLRREYDSLFQPMEEELYNEAVTFADPLIELAGVAAYKNNVNMLAGLTPFGRLAFSDGLLRCHAVELDADDSKLTTRWTLQFRFRLLPWQPLCRFTGVSRYTLDGRARVLRQQDYWDRTWCTAHTVHLPLGALLIPCTVAQARLLGLDQPAARRWLHRRAQAGRALRLCAPARASQRGRSRRRLRSRAAV